MDAVTRSLVQSSGTVLLVLLVCTAILAVMSLVFFIRFSRLQRKWNHVTGGGDRQSLEALLRDHASRHEQIHAELADSTRRLEQLEKKMKSAKRYLGFVRYNAFGDVAGEQSFALAIFDEDGNGAVISSLVGRQEARVYCKALVDGKPERDLGKEEEEAIERAARSAPSRTR